MRKTFFILTALGAAITVTVISCTGDKAKTIGKAAISNDSLIKRGAYIVNASGCDDCHSPKKMGPQGPELDMERRLSGFPASRPFPKYDSNVVKNGLIMFNEDLTSSAGPWGVSFAANLTSDETGLGNWSEAHFFKAIREGKFKGLDGSRSLLPPMPWQNFRNMKDEDVKAIFAFLKTTKPIKNVEPPIKPFSGL